MEGCVSGCEWVCDRVSVCNPGMWESGRAGERETRRDQVVSIKVIHSLQRLTRVGVGDFAGFVGVEPDLTLTAAEDAGGETLLNTQVDPASECGDEVVVGTTTAVEAT